eukprot:Sspe_Gene.10636::Locus_3560_Transcript_4_5_Confidence_0.400_Length_4151::g.10636::m.10636
MATRTPSPRHGGASLAMLVQQREMQNSRKLEALVVKNDELTEAYQHAERERQALLERLDYLEARITETCTGLVTQRREGEGKMREHSSRMSYLEQGVEERFRMVEQAVDEMRRDSGGGRKGDDSTRELHQMLEDQNKLIVQLQEKVEQKVEDRVGHALALVHQLAGKVGGMALQEELQKLEQHQIRSLREESSTLAGRVKEHGTTIAQQGENIATEVARLHKRLEQVDKERGEAMDKGDASLRGRCEDMDRLLKELEERLGAMQRNIVETEKAGHEQVARLNYQYEEAANRLSEFEKASEMLRSRSDVVHGKVQQLDDRFAAIDGRLQGMDSKQIGFEELLSVAEGRVKAVEALLSQLQEKVSQLLGTTAGTSARIENLEAKAGTAEGRLAGVEGECQAAVARHKGHAERIVECETRITGFSDTFRRVEEAVTQLTNDVNIMEEKRRLKEIEEDEVRAKRTEIERIEIEELQRDVELLKDRNPLIDETRVRALCTELDRGKEVLETIVKMNEVKLSERSEELEARVSRIESAIRQRGESANNEGLAPHPAHRHPVPAPEQPKRATTPHHTTSATMTMPDSFPSRGESTRGLPAVLYSSPMKAADRLTGTVDRSVGADRPSSDGLAPPPVSSTSSSGSTPSLHPSGAPPSPPARGRSTTPVATATTPASTPVARGPSTDTAPPHEPIQPHGGDGSGRTGTPSPSLSRPHSRHVSPHRSSSNSTPVVGGLRVPQLTAAGASDRSASGGQNERSQSPHEIRPTTLSAQSDRVRTLQQIVHSAEGSLPLTFDSIHPAEPSRSPYRTQAPPPGPTLDHRSVSRSASPRLSAARSPQALTGNETAAEIKHILEVKLQRSREAMEERRLLEADLERVNQQLSFIQMSFHALSQKEGTLGESKQMLKLESYQGEKAEAVRAKIMKMMEDIRRSKHNVYENERILVEEGNKLRRRINEMREGEKVLAEEFQRLQRLLCQKTQIPYTAPTYSAFSVSR